MVKLLFFVFSIQIFSTFFLIIISDILVSFIFNRSIFLQKCFSGSLHFVQYLFLQQEHSKSKAEYFLQLKQLLVIYNILESRF